MDLFFLLQAEVDGDRLISDVINNISRPIAFDAVMRVRTSTGVRATDFYGHYFMSNTTDMELASIDCDKVYIYSVILANIFSQQKTLLHITHILEMLEIRNVC